MFGHAQDDPSVDCAENPPKPAGPAAASASSVPVEKKNGGGTSSSAKPSASSNSSKASLAPAASPQPIVQVEQAVPLEADVPPEEPEVEEEFKAVRPEDDENKVLKPLFDFKKVYKRLQSDIVEKGPQTAKRLLLGLHERFYHCPIGDFKNMLLHAGLSSDILPLAEEAVMSCSVCREYVRMPNRPQVKSGANAGSSNQRVQIELFQYQEVWILLMVDEATRYKMATAVEGKEHGHF